MARIRTVKPEFFLHEELSKLPAETALLAIGLLCQSDDEGYFQANPRLLEAALFPLRNLSLRITEMLDQLSAIGYIRLGETVEGKQIGQVVKFNVHQRINKPTPSRIALLEVEWCYKGASAKSQGSGLPNQVQRCSGSPTGAVPERSDSPPVLLPPGKERNKDRNQEEDQEKEHEDEQEEEQERRGKGSKELAQEENLLDKSPPEKYLSIWNQLRGSLPEIRQFTDTRRERVIKRIAEGITVQQFEQIVRQCAETSFLSGDNEKGWKVTFDWLFANDNNMWKVLEGGYGF